MPDRVSLSLSLETETNGTGNVFGETNPTGSRPRDLIGLYTKWQRAKRPQPGELGIGIQQLKRHARSAVAVVMVASAEQANAWRPGREEAVKAMGLVRGTDQEERPQPAKKSSREEGGGDRGSTAARPTLTRDWGGPQVRDPVPIVSVNPEADPPQPRAPVRPNRAEQDVIKTESCLLYTSPSPRDVEESRMPSSA